MEKMNNFLKSQNYIQYRISLMIYEWLSNVTKETCLR